MHIFQGMPPVSLQGGPQKQQITLHETIGPIVLQQRRKTEERRGQMKIGKDSNMKGEGQIQQSSSFIHSACLIWPSRCGHVIYCSTCFSSLNMLLWGLWSNVKSQSTSNCIIPNSGRKLDVQNCIYCKAFLILSICFDIMYPSHHTPFNRMKKMGVTTFILKLNYFVFYQVTHSKIYVSIVKYFNKTQSLQTRYTLS